MGWWSFASDELQPIYARQLSLMPFAADLAKFFGDGEVAEAARARSRHPMMSTDGYVLSGLEREDVTAAAHLFASSVECADGSSDLD